MSGKMKAPSHATMQWARKLLGVAKDNNDLLKSQRLHVRGDANETMALALQLEHMMSEVFNHEYKEAKAQLLFRVVHEGRGASSVAKRIVERVGSMKQFAGNRVTDLPTISAFATKDPRIITRLGGKIEWSIFDVAAAAVYGESLDSTMLQLARDIFEYGIDEIAAVGDAAGTHTGAINDASVPVVALSAAGAWASDGQKMVNDVNAALRAFTSANSGLANPFADTLLLPGTKFQALSQTIVPNTGKFALQLVLEGNSQLKTVADWDRLVGAGSGGSDRLMACKASAIEINVPEDFTVVQPQAVGLGFEQPAYGTTSGAYIAKPIDVVYQDGI